MSDLKLEPVGLSLDATLYHYRAKLDRVIDGDTVRLFIDLGFRLQTVSTPCRLTGIDAPELTSGDLEIRKAAQLAKDFVVTRLSLADEVIVRSDRLDKYGRPLVTLYYHSGNKWTDLNQELVIEELAGVAS